MLLRIRAAVAVVLVGGWARGFNDHSVSLPMSTERNEQYGVNSYELAQVNRLYLTLRLSNPITRDSRVLTQTWIDTAADHCHISQRAAEAVGLRLSTEPPVLVHTPARVVRMHAVDVEYDLLDEAGVPISGFPRVKTHFYVNPTRDAPYDLVVGQVGFLDRIEGLKLDFRRRRIVLSW